MIRHRRIKPAIAAPMKSSLDLEIPLLILVTPMFGRSPTAAFGVGEILPPFPVMLPAGC
jgi:hypothetical protein